MHFRPSRRLQLALTLLGAALALAHACRYLQPRFDATSIDFGYFVHVAEKYQRIAPELSGMPRDARVNAVARSGRGPEDGPGHANEKYPHAHGWGWYPPVVFMFFEPFLWIDGSENPRENFRAMRLIYWSLNLLGVLALYFVWRRILAPVDPLRFTSAFVLLCLFSHPLLIVVRVGQINIMVLLALSLALLALIQGRDAWAGLCLALATALKVFPALFLPYLLWRRRYRSVVWAGVFGLALIVLPILHYGWELNRVYLIDYMLLGDKHFQKLTVGTVLGSWLGQGPEWKSAIQLIWLGVMSLLLGFGLTRRKASSALDRRTLLCEINLVMVFILLVSAEVSFYHFIFLLPAFLIWLAVPEWSAGLSWRARIAVPALFFVLLQSFPAMEALERLLLHVKRTAVESGEYSVLGLAAQLLLFAFFIYQAWRFTRNQPAALDSKHTISEAMLERDGVSAA